MYHYLQAEHRAQLAQYKYSSSGSSLISKYVLGPYWNWFVTLFPTSVAPNTITLSGLLLVVANLLTLFYYDGEMAHSTRLRAHVLEKDGVLPTVPLLPRGGLPPALASTPSATEGIVPSWMLVVWSLCLFLYQSLDAIDGKQARRTGMAGPLGELFDHGCDALNTSLEAILIAAITGLGRSSWTLVGLVSAMANFFLTTWEEYHTHTLFLSSFSGPVEGILMLCVLFLAVAYWGPAFCVQGLLHVTRLEEVPWVRAHLAWLNVPLGDLLMTLASVGLLWNGWNGYVNVRRQCRIEKRSPWTPLLGLWPFVLQCVAHLFWAQGQGSRIVSQDNVFIPFLLCWGLSFAYLVGLVILAHVCRTPYPYGNILIYLAVALAIDANLPAPLLQTSATSTTAVVYAALALASAMYAYFVYDVIHTITTESTSIY